jgi:tellurite resistance protein TehA-like permease
MSYLVWVGLLLALGSALATNVAYSFEHDAAAKLPPISPRRPVHAGKLLVHSRKWLKAFGAESTGWIMYVAALRLAPLALVQAVVASGVGILAIAAARGHPSRLARRERYAAVLALAGLPLLAISLIGAQSGGTRPNVLVIIVWLAACAGGAVLLIVTPGHFARAASLGLATGLLFADGDMSSKLVGYGGLWLIAIVPLIVGYGVGTSVLQSAYQKGDVLTAAGSATLVTNLVPIIASFVVFHETLPHGYRALLQVAAIGSLVGSAILLAHKQAPAPQPQSAPQPRGQPQGAAEPEGTPQPGMVPVTSRDSDRGPEPGRSA